MTEPGAANQTVVKLAQELLLHETDRTTITTPMIDAKIDDVLVLMPRLAALVDRSIIRDELGRRFSLWIGEDRILASESGHMDWLVPQRKTGWRYWQRYQEWQERKLSYQAVDALNTSTDRVLGLLEDPAREGQWDRRGLVVGHVQSGKTGHYTGLICKAADAGYKIVIVLAGLHNNLRSQTQIRLDEGFLGFETRPDVRESRIIGVGQIDGDPSIRPNYATNDSNTGDFNLNAARHLGITPEQRPWLFVVKKNKTVLERLLGWIRDHVANSQEPGTSRKVVTHLPLLLIDDEADNASVDTREQVFDEDGEPDPEHEPTAINRLIRQILHSFTRSGYVGYTATPFANIFIHEQGETLEQGPDLFPAAFIINLAAPSSYVGPARLFGLGAGEGNEIGLPLVREISDHAQEGRGWMPQGHKNGHVPLHAGQDALPDSLQEAMNAFLLACAIRRLRGQVSEHCSMLVHVTRFTGVQAHVHRQVGEHLRHLRQRLTRHIGDEAILLRLRHLWETDFRPTTNQTQERCPDPGVRPQIEWDEIVAQLPDAVAGIEVRMINGTAGDVLDYKVREATGLKVIAIGGDKLSRGLTLEGLCVSYFLRASRMYDTLMQMGRWFGYRPGYLDLCRLYTTSDILEWFGHIAEAAEELREEFDLMASSGATPREYGLRVQSHPVLLVTSPLKMRSARSLLLSFSGQLVETVTFHRDEGRLRRNEGAARRLIERLGACEKDPVRDRGDGRQHRWTGFLWQEVASGAVSDFLDAYQTHPAAFKVNSRLLAEFIRSMAARGELDRWTVALIGGGRGEPWAVGEGLDLRMLQRSAETTTDDRYSIGRLMSSRDEAIDLDGPAWAAALAETRRAFRPDPGRGRPREEPDVPNGPAIRKIRGLGADGIDPHPERGVLFLYVLDPAEAGSDIFKRGAPPVVGFAASFPSSESEVKVKYEVNHVLWRDWDRAYGSAE